MDVLSYDLQVLKKRKELAHIQAQIAAENIRLVELQSYIDTVDEQFNELSMWTVHSLRDFANDKDVDYGNTKLLLKVARIKKLNASKEYDNQVGVIVGVKESDPGVCSMVTMHLPSTNQHVSVKYSDIHVEKLADNLVETWSDKIAQIIQNGVLQDSRLFAYEWDAIEKNIFMVKFAATDKMLGCYKQSWSDCKIPTRIY
jgi:hypothetical protein